MLDQEDLKWIAATSTELNSILQQVARYADLSRRHRGEHNYIDLLAERVELASKTSQALFDHVTSKILAGAAKKTAAARKSEAGFTVVSPPETEEELRSLNPKVNVVLSSGFAEQTKIGTMLAQGLRGFIPKPYSREKLLEQVRSTLDAAKQPVR